MDKFNRKYRLFAQTQGGQTLIIEPPFTIEFDITRNSLSSANTSSIRIYNLSQKNRNLLRKNRWDYGDLRRITLQAGYGQNLPTIFDGNITQAWSVREGNNFITEIQSFDGGYAFSNAITNLPFPGGTPQQTILRTLASSMPGVSLGAIGNFAGNISRGNSFSGSTTDLLNELSGGAFFIDNGKVYCLKDSECIDGPIQVVSSASGLLGTPVREETYLNFEMLFEPKLIVAGIVQLDSITEANFNGFYKVISIKHRGMISETVAGNCVTSVGLFAPQTLVRVSPI